MLNVQTFQEEKQRDRNQKQREYGWNQCQKIVNNVVFKPIAEPKRENSNNKRQNKQNPKENF